jgi:IS5 family transposase
MAGLAILKSMHDLSDEALCARWAENPYFQLFCGEEFFRHALPFDRSSMTHQHCTLYKPTSPQLSGSV